MKLEDTHRILEIFNLVCDYLADNLIIAIYDTHQLDKECISLSIDDFISEDHAINDIDNFWSIMLEEHGVGFIDFHTKMSRWLKQQDDHEVFFKNARNKLSKNPMLSQEFNRKINESMGHLEADFMRYLPHDLVYLSTVFMQLRGFKKLTEKMAEMDFNIMLAVNENARNIHESGGYFFEIKIQTRDQQPVSSKLQKRQGMQLN